MDLLGAVDGSLVSLHLQSSLETWRLLVAVVAFAAAVVDVVDEVDIDCGDLT